MSLSAVPATDEGRRTVIRDTAAQDRAVAAPAPRRRYWLAGGAALLAVAVILAWPAWDRWMSADRSASAERLRTAVVERGEFVRAVSVQGTVVAAVSPTLYAADAGTVTLNVQAGDAVAVDQVLAVIDSPELANRLAQERARLTQLDMDLERIRIDARQKELGARQEADLAEVRIAAARRELARAEASMEYQVISVQDLEKARDDVSLAELEYRHATEDADLVKDTAAFEIRTRELERDGQRLAVDELERQLASLQVRSPVSGVIGDLAVDQKAAVERNQPLFTVVDLSAFEVELAVPQAYADDLGPDMPVSLRLGADEFDGRLAAVSPEVQNNEVRARVRFVDGAPEGLRRNQRISARVELERKADTLYVRRGPFLDDGAGRIAYVVSEGLAVRRPILAGSSGVQAVEILEGLEAGDTIVISSIRDFEGADTILITD